MYDKFFFLSGLPRSGSTLLLNIILQNPQFYSEGNSALCQLMWDAEVSCKINSYEQLLTSNKENFNFEYISQIPKIYYPVNKKYIIDKCRSWTMPDNYNLIKNYITKKPKIIVLTRDVKDIVKSFINIGPLYDGQTKESIPYDLFNHDEPLLRSVYGVHFAKNNYEDILFIDYKELVNDTKSSLNKIYSYLGTKNYDHNLSFIEQKIKENDDFFKTKIHSTRKAISFSNNEKITLPKDIEEACNNLNSLIY
jgi:sulfotransferase